jgi:molybdopterin-guanine dinucleotide biosynthesis protein A
LFASHGAVATIRTAKTGQLKISGFYDQVNVSYVSEDEIASLDPDFLSFFNVNTPDDLEKVLAWAEQGR